MSDLIVLICQFGVASGVGIVMAGAIGSRLFGEKIRQLEERLEKLETK